MSTAPRVALLIETSTSWGARIVQGIGEYAHRHGPWFFHIEPRGRLETLHLPSGWSGDGVIARVTSSSLADELTSARVSVVNVSCFDYKNERMARCTSDEPCTGRMAADYLLNLGVRTFWILWPTASSRLRRRDSDSLRRIAQRDGARVRRV